MKMKRNLKILIVITVFLSLLLTTGINAFAANGISLQKYSVSVGLNETADCIRFTSKNAKPTDYSYKSSNSKVASVNKKGQVKGKKVGSAVITVRRGNKSSKVKITVKKAPEKITLAATKLTLGLGESYDMNSSVQGGYSYIRKYSTSNKNVATAYGSIIRAKKVGTAVVTVRTYNGKKATCKVTVKKAPTKITITNQNNVIQKGANNHKVSVKLSSGSASHKISYKISNKSIATVNSKGYITGKKKGKTQLTVTTFNGKKATKTITVQDNSLSLNVKSTQIALDNPKVKHVVYGKSVQNRNLDGYIITPSGGYKKTIFIDFAVHGFEDSYSRDGKELTKLANNLISYFATHSSELKNYRLVIVPCVNPDGNIAGKNNKRACSSAFGRCTAKHIDMNRDFRAFKAVESRKLRDFIVDCKPKIYINGHGWLNETYGTTKLCQIIDKNVGLGAVNGGQYCYSQGYIIGWVHNKYNIPCCLLEYKSPKSLSTSKNVKMIKEVIKAYK